MCRVVYNRGDEGGANEWRVISSHTQFRSVRAVSNRGGQVLHFSCLRIT